MSRLLRTYDDAGYLHIVLRGNAQQNIFFDDMDRHKFLKELAKYSKELNAELIAYCLMDNHVHLIIHDEDLGFSSLMKKVEIAYVSYFNAKYSRCGHLFQGRFYSKAITNDSQLLCAIRYVHLNPQEAGLCSFEKYIWSSYSEYISGQYMCTIDETLCLFGGIAEFKHFHLLDNIYRLDRFPATISDSDARSIISEIVGSDNFAMLLNIKKEARNSLLSEMKSRGLSIRQISRITGISQGVVQRA